jgi:transcriptional regulator with XRE-family HTH domain
VIRVGKPTKLTVIQNLGLVNDWLATHGMTREKLARKLELTPTYLSRVLNGHEKPSLDLIERLAATIGCEWYELMLPPDKVVVDRREAERLENARRALRELVELTPA